MENAETYPHCVTTLIRVSVPVHCRGQVRISSPFQKKSSVMQPPLLYELCRQCRIITHGCTSSIQVIPSSCLLCVCAEPCAAGCMKNEDMQKSVSCDLQIRSYHKAPVANFLKMTCKILDCVATMHVTVSVLLYMYCTYTRA